MHNIGQALSTLRARISRAEQQFARPAGAVSLLAVSKTRPAAELRQAHALGQMAFGESYLQEAMAKMQSLSDLDIEWHFIGPLQSNKTRAVAERFAWVHSVDRLKIARRLSEQRPAGLPPLHLCLEVNVSGESSKSGVSPDQAQNLATAVAALPRLRLRGLMAVPAPSADFETQRAPFRVLRQLYDDLRAAGLPMDTLSMGMTADMEAAIAEGATIVRIGTAIFGPRD